MLNFSIIIPVYNRPDEVDELLTSLTKQTQKNFEVVVVEDGSSLKCEDVCQKYSKDLDIKYFFKDNSGRSDTRNFGMGVAKGNYFVIFDSDVILPSNYFEIINDFLEHNYTDCFGGPDNADKSFNNIQKAINYSMTSIMTTGGIRGATKNVDKFTPRSFNMGLSMEVYEKIGGFKNMIGEDIDLSIRIRTAGFKTKLIKDAFVFHKRRVSLKRFFRQVNTFGKGRVILHRMHPNSLKIVHLLPSFFFISNVLLLLLTCVLRCYYFILPILIYIVAVFVDSYLKNKSFKVAALSVVASYYQLFGYGIGFIDELLTRNAAKKSQEKLYKS